LQNIGQDGKPEKNGEKDPFVADFWSSFLTRSAASQRRIGMRPGG
jgi:hypothetical protein